MILSWNGGSGEDFCFRKLKEVGKKYFKDTHAHPSLLRYLQKFYLGYVLPRQKSNYNYNQLC